MLHSFHNCCQSFLFSHRHRLGLKRQMKKNAKMQDICNKETKTTAASLIGYKLIFFPNLRYLQLKPGMVTTLCVIDANWYHKITGSYTC